MWTWFYRLASPPHVYRVAAVLTPWFLTAAAFAIGYGAIAAAVKNQGMSVAATRYTWGGDASL